MKHLPAKTNNQWSKSAISDAHSAGIAYFCPFTVASGPRHHLTAFSHWKPCYCHCWDLQNSSHILFYSGQSSVWWVRWQAFAQQQGVYPSSPLDLRHNLDRSPSVSANLAVHSPYSSGSGPTKSSPWLSTPSYICIERGCPGCTITTVFSGCPAPTVLCQLPARPQFSCLRCPVHTVMSWPSCPLCLPPDWPVRLTYPDWRVRAVRSQFSCSRCLDPTILSWLSWHGCPGPVSCLSCPVLDVMSCLLFSILVVPFPFIWPGCHLPALCPSCPIPAVLFQLLFSAVLSQRSCPQLSYRRYPVSDVMSWQSCPICLPRLTRPIHLYWLTCPSYLVPVPSKLSSHCCPVLCCRFLTVLFYLLCHRCPVLAVVFQLFTCCPVLTV